MSPTCINCFDPKATLQGARKHLRLKNRSANWKLSVRAPFQTEGKKGSRRGGGEEEEEVKIRKKQSESDNREMKVGSEPLIPQGPRRVFGKNFFTLFCSQGH